MSAVTAVIYDTSFASGQPLAPVPPRGPGSLLKSWYYRYVIALRASDGLAIGLAVAIAYLWRFGRHFQVPVAGSSLSYPVVATVIGVLWWLVLDAQASRTREVVGHGLEEYRRVIRATLYNFGALAILSYLTTFELSRGFFLIVLPLGTVLLLAGRWLGRQILHRRRAVGGAFTPTVVVGGAYEVRDVVRDLRRHQHAGFNPVAVALARTQDREAIMNSAEMSDLPIINLEDLTHEIAGRRVRAVVVAPGLKRERVRRLAWDLENHAVKLLFVPSLTDVAGPRMTVNVVEGLSLVSVDLPRYSGWNHLLKRAFDIVFASLALVALAPVLAVVAVLIKREDGGPVFFRQERIGLRGEPFVIHKFRSMRVDAEAHLAALLAEADTDGPLFKMEDDPRLTKIGKVLRKYSIDELPQFWTVLGGHMSVVGPRPHLARELAEYPMDGLRRLLIKPGITGLWQVSGRSDLSFEDALRLDLRYVENWSLTGDLTIILRTIRTVLRPAGAY